jgi:Flp pilus assembly pilin Flp
MIKNLALRVLVAFQGLESKVQDEEGQTLAEYGLIMAVVAVAIVAGAVVAFRGAIVGAFDKATA